MSARKTKDGFPAEATLRILDETEGEYVAWVNPDEMMWEAWYENGSRKVPETAITPCHPTWRDAIAEVKQRRRDGH